MQTATDIDRATPGTHGGPAGSRDALPDREGIVRLRGLGYGFTPKAIAETRVALRALRGLAGVRLVAIDVGRNLATPRTRLFAALVADLDGIREDMCFCTLAMPSGDLEGMALELSLACAMTTLDHGACVRLGPYARRDPVTDRRLAWALGPRADELMAGDAIPHGDVLELALATVVCAAQARWEAAREVAARLGRRQLSFMALDRSLALVRRGAGVGEAA